MDTTRIAAVALAAALAGGMIVVGGCHEGPAERIGEKIDGKGDTVRDKLKPDGAGEKTGKKVDRAVDDLTR